jgi:hypothetical protein
MIVPLLVTPPSTLTLPKRFMPLPLTVVVIVPLLRTLPWIVVVAPTPVPWIEMPVQDELILFLLSILPLTVLLKPAYRESSAIPNPFGLVSVIAPVLMIEPVMSSDDGVPLAAPLGNTMMPVFLEVMLPLLVMSPLIAPPLLIAMPADRWYRQSFWYC